MSATRSTSSGSAVVGTRISSSQPRSAIRRAASRRVSAESVVTVGASFFAACQHFVSIELRQLHPFPDGIPLPNRDGHDAPGDLEAEVCLGGFDGS